MHAQIRLECSYKAEEDLEQPYPIGRKKLQITN